MCDHTRVTVSVVTASVIAEDANYKTQIALCPAGICNEYCLCSYQDCTEFITHTCTMH